MFNVQLAVSKPVYIGFSVDFVVGKPEFTSSVAGGPVVTSAVTVESSQLTEIVITSISFKWLSL